MASVGYRQRGLAGLVDREVLVDEPPAGLAVTRPDEPRGQGSNSSLLVITALVDLDPAVRVLGLIPRESEHLLEALGASLDFAARKAAVAAASAHRPRQALTPAARRAEIAANSVQRMLAIWKRRSRRAPPDKQRGTVLLVLEDLALAELTDRRRSSRSASALASLFHLAMTEITRKTYGLDGAGGI